MNYKLVFETVRHLKPTQLYYQLRHRLFHPRFRPCVSPIDRVQVQIVPFIEKPLCQEGNSMEFLHIRDTFQSWCMTEHGMLWAYNLNYMDWLCQGNMTQEEGERWIDAFIKDLAANSIGQDAAPTALRCVNWMKFFMTHPNSATKERLDSLYSQMCLLSRKLEHHLLGNHLLEDAFALFFASVFFHDHRLYRKASKLLLEQLKEQVLADGAHFEQSPMYHCIMLDRLLDCYNISTHNAVFVEQTVLNGKLKDTAERMLGHLMAIVYQDGSIPLLNDSAQGIAPTSAELLEYALRLQLEPRALPLRECGYRKMQSEEMEAIVDIGNITATYQPGHTHADTFTFELRIDGKPFIVDTGISTYDKTSRRQYERSTKAHNTVSINGKDSSHVWGGFRVGKRARVKVETDSPSKITAAHDGFGKLHTRSFTLNTEGFSVEDTIDSDSPAVSYIHLAPSLKALVVNSDRIEVGKHVISFHGAEKIDIVQDFASTAYNCFEKIDVIEMHFHHQLSYTIQ